MFLDCVATVVNTRKCHNIWIPCQAIYEVLLLHFHEYMHNISLRQVNKAMGQLMDQNDIFISKVCRFIDVNGVRTRVHFYYIMRKQDTVVALKTHHEWVHAFHFNNITTSL